MGADLYIEKIHRPLMKKYEPLFDEAVKHRDSLHPKSSEFGAAQEKVTAYYDLMYSDGYFRDSYNATSILNQMDLSWWRDVTPLCSEDKKLRDDSLRTFRTMVADATLRLPNKDDIERQGGKVTDTGDSSLIEWHRYFTEKRVQLLSFLDKAIRLNSAIHCSL